MVANYLSPLAPAAILLLSAFILSIVLPRLPEAWRSHWLVRYALAPALVVLAGLAVLGTELSNPIMLSGWHFGTAESGAGLEIGVDTASLAYLLLTLIILLVVMLFSLPLASAREQSWTLILGASAVPLFMSANLLTLSYTVLLFDLLLARHWLIHQQTNLSIARLFLGILTAGGLMISTELWGATLLVLPLWLRLGLYPLFEMRVAEKRVQNYNFLTYWSFSLAVGIYLVSQTLTVSLPENLCWLITITMLLNGVLAWLFQTNTEGRPTLLTRLVFTQALLPLLLVAPSAEITAAYALGLTLSLATLWITPRLGKIDLSNLSRFWPYLAPLVATLTLIGLPFLLNWPIWATFYPTSFSSDAVKVIVVILAIMLALSGLARYWLELWNDESTSDMSSYLHSAIAAVVAAVPFLIPGLALFVLSTIMQIDFPSNPDTLLFTLIVIAVTATGAIGLGYFRTQIITRLNVSPEAWIKIFNLQWLLIWMGKGLNQIGKFILRVNVILEGQHYIGWALVTALVGTLIVILMRST